MATITYSGSISSATSLNKTPTVSLSSSDTAAGVVNSVTATLTFSTNAYGTRYNVTATLYYDGGSVTSTRQVKLTSENYTGAKFDFTFDGLTLAQVNSITGVRATSSNSSTTIFLKGTQTVTVDYMFVSSAGAPTTIQLSSGSTAPGATVKLSWSGATAGTNNAITGYKVYRATSSGGSYSLLTTVSSSATSGSMTVVAPTTNGSAYYYRVQTLGTIGGYDSGQSNTYATLTCNFASAGAPTSVSLSITNVAPNATATLNWSGASAGANNAITGYNVLCSESLDGEYDILITVETTETSGSTTVTAPSTNGAAYYYRVQTLGTLLDCDSDQSSAYAVLTCTYTSPSAPSSVTVSGVSAAYVYPGVRVALTWSGAAAGANNAITGYDIYRDDEVLVEGLAADVSSYDVVSHDTAGNYYTYVVVTRGTYVHSARSAPCVVYSFTDPVAPTEVTVSSAEASPGTKVALSWSGAEAGGYNNITGYRVYRSTEVNGENTLVANLATTSTSSSTSVAAPTTPDGVYYFRVEVVGQRSNSLSEAYASVTASGNASGTDDEVTIIVKPSKRKKRGMVFGDYDTAEHQFTLTGWEFSEPEAWTSYIEVPGRSKGPLDMSTALTGGDPRYLSRYLDAVFELSEGTRMDREVVITEMVNQLNGMRVNITLPDDPSRYAVGRLMVKKTYNDMAHAEVTVGATCDPWRYSKEESRVEYAILDEAVEIVLSNNGRRIVSPEVTVTGYDSTVVITNGNISWELPEGTYKLPELTLAHGNTTLTCSGFGTVSFVWQEAIL